MIQGAIFDVDGTLLDSMPIWDNIAELYLRSLGYTPRENLTETFKTFSMHQAACYYQTHYGVPLSADEIVDGINRLVERYYREEVLPKAGIKPFLEELRQRGVKICIATATDEYLVDAALRRCGMRDYFSQIFTCTGTGSSKNEPHIYREALQHLGTEKAQTFVFEDAFHAARTAKNDGFPVVAIYDPSEDQQEELTALADVCLRDYTDPEAFWKFASM